jgi:AcrR family transcriptional regulator
MLGWEAVSTIDLTPAPVPEASLRERKKSATRAALRRAAVELVESRGLCAVTIEDIAHAADVAPRTFFNYFSSKVDAISGLDPDARAELVRRLQQRPAHEPPLEALRAAMLGTPSNFTSEPRDLLRRLALVRSDPHLLAHHVSAWAETERALVMALVERTGRERQRERYLTLLVATVLSAARVATLSWCERGGEVPLVEELALHLDMLQSGLREPATEELG